MQNSIVLNLRDTKLKSIESIVMALCWLLFILCKKFTLFLQLSSSFWFALYQKYEHKHVDRSVAQLNKVP